MSTEPYDPLLLAPTELRFSVRGTPWWVPAVFLAFLFAPFGCQKPATPAPFAPTEEEQWFLFRWQGAPIGHVQWHLRPVTENGESLIVTDSKTVFTLLRFGQTVHQETSISTTETAAGELKTCSSVIPLGNPPIIATAVTLGSQLQLNVKQGASDTTTLLPWQRGTLGFGGLETALRRHPLRAGDKRRLQILLPAHNLIATTSLTALQPESVELPGGARSLLRIQSETELPGGVTQSETIWADESGAVWRSLNEKAQQEMVRVTREEALAVRPPSGFDVGTDAIVRLAAPLERPDSWHLIRYRVHVTDDNPLKLFAQKPGQTMRAIDDHTIELTVRRVEPTLEPGPDVPAPADLAANQFLQIDDPEVQRMAKEGRKELDQPWEIAKQLEGYVKESIRVVSFSSAFASAAEVAQSRTGDCTEHAVLLAALCRANQIPARVAMGLVYLPQYRGFGYHMWTEVNIRQQWIPLDATLGRGGTDAVHLKLADSNLQNGEVLTAVLPITQLLGRLQIEVLAKE